MVFILVVKKINILGILQLFCIFDITIDFCPLKTRMKKKITNQTNKVVFSNTSMKNIAYWNKIIIPLKNKTRKLSLKWISSK